MTQGVLGGLERRALDLPIKRWGLMSHTDNINYAIEQLRDHPDYVIGYRLVRSTGTTEMFHELITKDEADELRRTDSAYQYKSIDDLLKQKRQIDEGKFKIKNGLIVGLNAPYS